MIFKKENCYVSYLATSIIQQVSYPQESPQNGLRVLLVSLFIIIQGGALFYLVTGIFGVEVWHFNLLPGWSCAYTFKNIVLGKLISLLRFSLPLSIMNMIISSCFFFFLPPSYSNSLLVGFAITVLVSIYNVIQFTRKSVR